MKKINDIIPEGKYKLAFADQPKREIEVRITPGVYKTMFFRLAASHLQFKGGDQSFIVDQDNTTVINQLYLYLIGLSTFNGNLNNGIILIGKIGSGKTLLMHIFVDIIFDCLNKKIQWIHSKEIEQTVNDGGKHTYNEFSNSVAGAGISWFSHRPILIDDIGKEQEQVKDFGTVRKPFEDLISYRYGKRNITFGTSNLTLEDMPYSNHTKDRLREICNIIELPGNSRRK